MDELKGLSGHSAAAAGFSESSASSSSTLSSDTQQPSRDSITHQQRKQFDAERFVVERGRVLQRINIQIELFLGNPSSPHVRMSEGVRSLLNQLLEQQRSGVSPEMQLQTRARAVELAEREYILDDGSHWADRVREFGDAALAFQPSSSSSTEPAADTAASSSDHDQQRHQPDAERMAAFQLQRERVLQHLNTQIELYLVKPLSPYVRLSAEVCAILDQLLDHRRRGLDKLQQLRIRGRALDLAESEYVLEDGSRWSDRLAEFGDIARPISGVFPSASSSRRLVRVRRLNSNRSRSRSRKPITGACCLSCSPLLRVVPVDPRACMCIIISTATLMRSSLAVCTRARSRDDRGSTAS